MSFQLEISPTSAFVSGNAQQSAIPMATSRCREVWASGRATLGIAIIGLDRRHDRFGRPSAR
jgi:hypothetical protein